MKIALVFPPFRLESMYNLPPLGLINLATAVQDLGHEVVLLDLVLDLRKGTLKPGPGIYDAGAERILAEHPDLVAFSAQCTTYPPIIQIARKLRGLRGDVKIVLGGHNASFLDQATLTRYPFIDAVVRGEGERTFREMTECLSTGGSLGGIAGVSFRDGETFIRNPDRPLIPNLDDLPLPDYRFAPPLEEYRSACGLPRSIAILEVGRGCPHRCIYCSESLMWQRRTRTFSATRLVKEMENLRDNFGAECFLLAYDQFTANRRFVEAFCSRVMEAGLQKIPWYCISRLDSVDRDLLSSMRQAGCESMCYGIDSGSKRTLAFIRKKIDREILHRRVIETAEQGIIPTLSFVIGFPEESQEDIDETLWLALKCGVIGNNNPLIQMPTVLPGTDLHKRYLGSLVRAVDTYFAQGIEWDGGKRLPSDEALIDSAPEIYSSFYNLPCKGLALEDLDLIAGTFPLVVRFYPKTFMLLSLELGESPSSLHLRWIDWLRHRKGLPGAVPSPRDHYLHFREFVGANIEGRPVLVMDYLPEMLVYENCALDVGRFAGTESLFAIDLQGISDLVPVRNHETIVQSFDYDLPAVISDMKGEGLKGSYPKKKTWLVFRQEGDHLEVTEINEFGRDLLSRCDGATSLHEISRGLFPRYAGAMDEDAFVQACEEAAGVFGQMGLLRFSPMKRADAKGPGEDGRS